MHTATSISKTRLIRSFSGEWRTNLNQKTIKGERILLQHNPPRIANLLTNAPKQHGSHESPGAVSDPLRQMDDQGDTEEGDEDGAGGEGGLVFVDAVGDGADGEGAVFVGAVGDVVAWVVWVGVGVEV